MQRFILQVFILVMFWAMPAEVWGQTLRELSVEEYDLLPETPTIIANYPDNAYLVFHSSITNLQFESNWGIVADLSRPEQGRYILVMDTVRQLLKISVPGSFRVREHFVPQLLPKQMKYYRVEPANNRPLEEARSLYEQSRFAEADDLLNAYLLRANLTEEQRARAHQLHALCLYALDQKQRMRRALHSLMQVNPRYQPEASNPEEVNTFVSTYRDSVYRAAPAQPVITDVTYNNAMVVIQWRPNAEHDVARYNIYRETQGEREKELLQSVGPDYTSYVDADVESFKTYYYQISVTDSQAPAQEGPLSGIRAVHTLPALAERMQYRAGDNDVVQDVEIRTVSDSVVAFVYDLSGPLHRSYDVSVSLSNNEGVSFNLIPRSVAGDYGARVQDGPRKEIRWNYLRDFPAGLPAERYLLNIEATPRPLADQVKLIPADDTLITQYELRPASDSLLHIFYTLRSMRRHTYRVDLSFSRDENSSYEISLNALSGDIGEKKKGGRTYKIDWRMLEDFPDGLDGPIVLKLQAVPQPADNRRLLYLAAGGVAVLGGAWALLGTAPEEDNVASRPEGRP